MHGTGLSDRQAHSGGQGVREAAQLRPFWPTRIPRRRFGACVLGLLFVCGMYLRDVRSCARQRPTVWHSTGASAHRLPHYVPPPRMPAQSLRHPSTPWRNLNSQPWLLLEGVRGPRHRGRGARRGGGTGQQGKQKPIHAKKKNSCKKKAWAPLEFAMMRPDPELLIQPLR